MPLLLTTELLDNLLDTSYCTTSQLHYFTNLLLCYFATLLLYYLRLTTYDLRLTACDLLLTTYYLRLATCHLLHCYVLLTTCNSTCTSTCCYIFTYNTKDSRSLTSFSLFVLVPLPVLHARGVLSFSMPSRPFSLPNDTTPHPQTFWDILYTRRSVVR